MGRHSYIASTLETACVRTFFVSHGQLQPLSRKTTWRVSKSAFDVGQRSYEMSMNTGQEDSRKVAMFPHARTYLVLRGHCRALFMRSRYCTSNLLRTNSCPSLRSISCSDLGTYEKLGFIRTTHQIGPQISRDWGLLAAPSRLRTYSAFLRKPKLSRSSVVRSRSLLTRSR